MSDEEHSESEFYYPEETNEGNNQKANNKSDDAHSKSEFHYPEETDEGIKQNPNKDLSIASKESQQPTAAKKPRKN